MELKSQHSHLMAKEQITLLQRNSFFNLLCWFLHFAQMWSLYSEINNFIKNESWNIAVKSSVSDSFQYVNSYEKTSTFCGRKLLTSLCCLVNRVTFLLQNHLFDGLKLVRQTGKQWLHQTIIHSISILLEGWLKQGSVNRSSSKWSWSKLLASTKVKIRQRSSIGDDSYFYHHNYEIAKGQLFPESALYKWLLVFISFSSLSHNTPH